MTFEQAFENFSQSFHLSLHQQRQFQRYMQLLLQENEKFNLTAITDPVEVIFDHFFDSLSLVRFIDLNGEQSLGDIGSGAGFPAIPLKIFAPNLPLIIIEVNQKKVSFLEQVQRELGLDDITFSLLDWRTFLRKTEFDVTLFTARASLHPEELVRVFKPSSRYRHAELIYYASEQWVPEGREKEYVRKRVSYQVRNKRRSLIFFAVPALTVREEYL